jgi:hypothetical protein
MTLLSVYKPTFVCCHGKKLDFIGNAYFGFDSLIAVASGIWYHVMLERFIYVSEEGTASIFIVKDVDKKIRSENQVTCSECC